MESSDDDIFLTQNTFRANALENTIEQEHDIDDLWNIIDNNDINLTQYLDKKDPDDDFSDIDNETLIKASQQAEYSDITDEECDSRFDFKKDSEVAEFSKKLYADKTEEKIQWAIRLFKEWISARNHRAITDKSLQLSPILVELQHMSKDELNYSLSRFVVEARKKNGQLYPGKTIWEVILCIQFYLEKVGKCYKLLSDITFQELQNTLDNIMKATAKKGVGLQVKKAKEISIQDEEKLWKLDVLGSDNPTSLLNALFYQIGVQFALRGGQEHRGLCVGAKSQFTISSDSDGCRYLQYTQDVCKTNTGGLKHLKVQPKCVRAYENSNKERCIIRLYEEYLLRCPTPRPDSLYLRPLTTTKYKTWKEQNIWYSAQPVGLHALTKMVHKICLKGGLSGYYTNHSLRATAASRLYGQGIDEQLIQETTGHRSIAVRSYKRTSDPLKRSVSTILNGKSATVSKAPKMESNSTDRNIHNDENPHNVSFTVNIKF